MTPYLRITAFFLFATAIPLALSGDCALIGISLGLVFLACIFVAETRFGGSKWS